MGRNSVITFCNQLHKFMKCKSMIGKSKLGFSLVELSVVLLVVAILMFSVMKGSELIGQAKLGLARQKTANSPVTNMKNLVLWIETTSTKSFLTSETLDSSSVSVWNDIGGASPNNPIVFVPVGPLPTYVSNLINGLPAVRFDAPLRFLNSNLRNVGNGGFAIFMVILDKTGGQTVLSYTDYNSHAFSLFVSGSNGAYYTSFNNMGGDTSSVSGLTSITGSPKILLSHRNNAGYTMEVNGAPYLFTSGTTGDFSTFQHVNEIRIGGNNGNLYMSELIVFDRSLSDQEIQDIERYLSDKYDIAISS